MVSVAQGAMKDQLRCLSVASLDRYIRLLLGSGRICQTNTSGSSYLDQPTPTYHTLNHERLLDDCDLAMHLYAYGDLDRSTESQSALDNSSMVTPDSLVDDMIILLDEDDDVSDANISFFERQKIGLPKRIRNACSSAVAATKVEWALEQENMIIEQDSSEGEIFQSMSCMLGLRNISLEELRLECYLQCRVATGQSPKPVATPSAAIPPSFSPWYQEELDDSPISQKRVRLEADGQVFTSVQPNLTAALSRGVTQVLMFQ